MTPPQIATGKRKNFTPRPRQPGSLHAKHGTTLSTARKSPKTLTGNQSKNEATESRLRGV
jgi:hypothetical protein